MKSLFINLFVFFLFWNCAETTEQARKESSETIQQPPIITRQQWGWKTLTDSMPTQIIKRITVHHGGVYFSPDSDAVAYIQKLQDWSRENKHWIDIPYHYMIDFQGKIYEARPIRFPGDTNTDYDPRGHALICVIGNFEEQQVNEQQLNSLSALIRWLMAKYNVPIDSVKTHKDYTETLCPGKNLYQYFRNGDIQKRVLRK